MSFFIKKIESQKCEKLAEDIDKIFPLEKDIKKAISKTPREIFVPIGFKHLAYKLDALPISANQWISSPLTVAKMTQYLIPEGADSVLEIGCGSGYQAAILSQLFRRVFSVERVEKLVSEAKKRFKELDLININVRYSDGLLGWREFSPYDRILFSASITNIPETIFEQLSSNKGILVAPIQKDNRQIITRFIKNGNFIKKEELEECLFVPTKKGTV
ncbi:protein-L-isoaspartate(D-aspartate) O-methyltransferase [Nitrosophilus kaiyonis]|uniref:protein-L-isoaspartate(D-aspartate) O-methyltransferase n=1 Tax=Nitrosophilus kaiyonis TaxID=2930200 RepID=UPI0024939E1D|nr:protein-L-isoaspartate(D-aspartate) O-methyltransferase [Nitrosophilus kaiyonis]